MLLKVLNQVFAGLLFSVSFSYATAQVSGDPVAIIPPKGLIPENLILLNAASTHPKYIFVADKSQRTLTVWSNKDDQISLHGAYPMDIGKSTGDKLAQGDQRTPEGVYFFQTKLEGAGLNFSEYGRRAFTLDYPNIFDRMFGKSGNGIWLHAIPETKTLLRGSRGCVVVRNEIIEQLTPLIELERTPIVIIDKVNYVDPAGVATNRKALEDWIAAWKTNWESKNLDSYMTHYSDSFYSMKMNKEKWRRYKKALNEKYATIKVGVKSPFVIARHGDTLIRFVQQYDSEGVKDIGEKTLYVRKSDGGKYEIMAESWHSISSELLAHLPAVY